MGYFIGQLIGILFAGAIISSILSGIKYAIKGGGFKYYFFFAMPFTTSLWFLVTISAESGDKRIATLVTMLGIAFIVLFFLFDAKTLFSSEAQKSNTSGSQPFQGVQSDKRFVLLKEAYSKGIIDDEEFNHKLILLNKEMKERQLQEKNIEQENLLNQKLEKLENLYKENLLTKEEYEQKITKLKNQS